MKRARDKSQFSAFGLWLQDYCRPDMVVSNLDYIIKDYNARPWRLMLLEEKCYSGRMNESSGQWKLFCALDTFFISKAKEFGFDYWGLHLLVMPGESPGPGMTLNGRAITCEQLVAHINFEQRFSDGYFVECDLAKAS